MRRSRRAGVAITVGASSIAFHRRRQAYLPSVLYLRCGSLRVHDSADDRIAERTGSS